MHEVAGSCGAVGREDDQRRRSGRSAAALRPISGGPQADQRRRSVVELVLVALAGARLGAEATLESTGAHAGRWAARLGVAGPAALEGPVAIAAGLEAPGLAPLLGEGGRPRRVAQALLLL